MDFFLRVLLCFRWQGASDRTLSVSFMPMCARGSLARCDITGGPLKFGFQINSEYFQYKYAPRNT